jgi:hypothetical protein
MAYDYQIAYESALTFMTDNSGSWTRFTIGKPWSPAIGKDDVYFSEMPERTRDEHGNSAARLLGLECTVYASVAAYVVEDLYERFRDQINDDKALIVVFRANEGSKVNVWVETR